MGAGVTADVGVGVKAGPDVGSVVGDGVSGETVADGTGGGTGLFPPPHPVINNTNTIDNNEK